MITGQIGARRQPQLREQEMLGAMAAACGAARISWRFKERDEAEVMIAAAPVIKRAGNLSVPLPPGAFMQPSAEGEAALIAAALSPLAGKAGLKIVDLFAGCGTFSGPLLAHGAVHALEGDEAAIKALAVAARGVSGLTTEQRNLFTDPLMPAELKKYDAVLFDPPRAGALAQTAEIAKSAVPVVIGVSCNPATFARDAALLCEGGYKLQSVTLVDQFTWSAHVEIVAVFTR
jgi:23S rRNA (uracil1939-C5)-methyltransferase